MNTDAEIRRIYERWHETVRDRDREGTVALYAEDAIFESPLVTAVHRAAPDASRASRASSGELRGKAAIRAFFEAAGGVLRSDAARWYRTGTFFSNGRQLIWEYPRETPQGNQIDLVEVMDIAHGLIAHHRVYWGWFGFELLLDAISRKMPP